MDISSLIIMQEDLSEVDQFQEMVKFIRDGGFFTKTALEQHESDITREALEEIKEYPKVRLISITEFEDGTLFIHDGHHRIGAILKAGREYLRDDEYTITKMRYAQYDEINADANFVTPFVPYMEVRLSDFSDFKNTAIRLFRNGKPHDAVYYIRNNRSKYCRVRQIRYVKDLIKGM
jgi:asparagine N-glycosylation enzyme membrane subunit Stt3